MEALTPAFRPQNVAEFFFSDEGGEMPRDLDYQEVDLIYNEYVRIMTCMHEKLRAIYNQLVQKCVDPDLQKEHAIAVETGKLILPGEEIDDRMFEEPGQEEIKVTEDTGTINPADLAPQVNGEPEGDEQYNIEDTNESFSERKNHTTVPSLKNNRNALNKGAQPFSERILMGKSAFSIDPKDTHSVANCMMFEINVLAGHMITLWHKLNEALKVAPRNITELLMAEYNEKMRDRWSESIFRNVVPTKDFAWSHEDDIGETHKKVAKTRRANLLYQATDSLQVEDLQLFPEQAIHPIVFEECYVKDFHLKALQLSRQNLDLVDVDALHSEDGQAVDYK